MLVGATQLTMIGILGVLFPIKQIDSRLVDTSSVHLLVMVLVSMTCLIFGKLMLLVFTPLVM